MLGSMNRALLAGDDLAMILAFSRNLAQCYHHEAESEVCARGRAPRSCRVAWRGFGASCRPTSQKAMSFPFSASRLLVRVKLAQTNLLRLWHGSVSRPGIPRSASRCAGDGLDGRAGSDRWFRKCGTLQMGCATGLL